MYSLLYFDTEDSISPPEAGNDDIVLWIADVLTRYGVTGSFHIIGDKARTLDSRGRRDVIEAVKRHDVSSHYNHGSIHPTTTELIAEVGWDEGVNIALTQERPGFEDIERIFGRCSALTRHGGSYSPQAVHAAGRCGKVFYGIPFHPPGHRAFHFAGNLCFSICGLIMEGPGYFEPVYHDDAAFEKHLAAFRPAVREVARDYAFTALFGCHPLRLNTTEFACFNYYGGVNRDKPIPPPQRSDAQKQTIKRNFDRYIAHLATIDEVDILGLDELTAIFGDAPKRIAAADLDAYAERVRDGDDVPLHDDFSPAELLVALAQRHVAPAEGYDVMHVIGPTQTPPNEPLRDVTPPELEQMARDLIAFAQQNARLPHTVNLAALLDLLAQHGDVPRSSGERPAYPRVADDWRSLVQSMARWVVFGPDLDLSRIIDLTCLQAWSVKPAHART